MDCQRFLSDRNVVVFFHFTLKKEIGSLKDFIRGRTPRDELKEKLRERFGSILGPFATREIARHVKTIYLFFAEGLYHELTGKIMGMQFEEIIRELFEDIRSELVSKMPELGKIDTPLIGMKDLNPLLASIEVEIDGVQLRDFMLKKDGTGGYDTPKIAFAIIRLARLKYCRDEMFIRIDDDVKPSVAGILQLKEQYCQIVSVSNHHFCFSYHYESVDLSHIVNATTGPNYEKLFDHYVNSYSIRTSFMVQPYIRCFVDRNLNVKIKGDLKDADLARLDLVGIRYFIDLFKRGKWGSDLNDVVSGAGMCFSTASLEDLPPWCNADESISWIDDMIKWDLMSIYYGNHFRNDVAMIARHQGMGFPQKRARFQDFDIGNVKWHVKCYLDRLLMGCILGFAVNPEKYRPGFGSGFGNLVREKDYNNVRVRWESGMRESLREAALEHVHKVLMDWHCHFCENDAPVDCGYIALSEASSLKPPKGFVKAPADTPFNAYVLRRLIGIARNEFDLVDRVFLVLDRFLDLKYRFWPYLVNEVAKIRDRYEKENRNSSIDSEFERRYGWLFKGVDMLSPSDPKPMRESRSSYALIQPPKGDGKDTDRWLVQWNEKWQVMNLISGHQEYYDNNELTCMIREIHEELFRKLDNDKLAEMNQAMENETSYLRGKISWNDPFVESAVKICGPEQYVAFSESQKIWTKYIVTVFEVKLDWEKVERIFGNDVFLPALSNPKDVNEFVSWDEIDRGYTLAGRPVSDTVKRVFKMCKIQRPSNR